MNGQEVKVPPLRFRMPPVDNAESAETGGGRILAVPWREKRLGNIFTERQSRSIHGELLSVSINSGVFPASQNGRYDNSSIGNGNYKCVVHGDIAYNSMRMWQGACGASAYDGLVSPAYTVVIPDDEADSVFFEYAFKRNEMLFAFRQHSQGLTSDTWNLKYPLFAQIPICSPALSEQRQIASLFRSLDALIAGREKALEKLEVMKKAMLQKMFPQGDVKVPEVRFKGFTGEWEKKRLGDFGDCQSGEGFPEIEQGGKEGIPFFKVSDMNLPGNDSELVNANNYVTEEQIKKSAWHPVEKLPAIFFAKVGAAVMLNRKRVVKMRFLLDNNTMAFRLDDSIDADFAKSLFDTIDLSALSQTGALPSINASDVEDMLVLTPIDISEQRKIGTYFRSLDTLLAARREEVEKLKQMKKALLERMFV